MNLFSKGPYSALIIGGVFSLALTFAFNFYHELKSENKQLKSEIRALLHSHDIEAKLKDGSKPLESEFTKLKIKELHLEAE